MITGDPLLVDSFDADHHIACLHDEDLHNAVLHAAGYYNVDHHDADPRNSDPQDADPRSINPHNVNCRSCILRDTDPHNAGSREPPLKGIASKGDDRARGTDIDCFEASNAGEENRLDYMTRDLAEVELAGAAGSVRPRSERSRCWAP
jgi:hypothetical protein